MKRALKTLRFITIALMALMVVLIAFLSIRAGSEADAAIAKADILIETHERYTEPETVSLSYAEYLDKKADYLDIKTSYQQVNEPATEAALETFEEVTWTEEQVNLDTMDVWTLGAYLYGIPEHDTTRSLILITYEGYGPESPLSYYTACCCYVRATEGLWGYQNLYQAFGEMDTSYDLWMDSLGYADYSIEALRQCYLNPTYVRYCNGMTIPESWVYEENGIYVW